MAAVVFIDTSTKRYKSSITNVVASDYQNRNDVVIYDGDANITTIYALLPHAPYLIQDAGTLLIRDMVQAEKDSLDSDNAATLLALTRTSAKNNLVGTIPNPMLYRAIGGVLVDEINLVREWIVSFKAATAAATSLPNLQSRVAALADLPDRTLTQFKTAVQAKIDSGSVDS